MQKEKKKIEQALTVEELNRNPGLRAQLRKKWDNAITTQHTVPRNGNSDKNTTQPPIHLKAK